MATLKGIGITIMAFKKYGKSSKVLGIFGAFIFNSLVREKCLELCQTCHIPRTEHHNRYSSRFSIVAIGFCLAVGVLRKS